MSTKSMLALAAAAALLAGCATGPYYDNNYAYGDGSYYNRPADNYYNRPADNYYYAPPAPAYRYGYAPGYYTSPYYAAPSVGFGITYSNRGYRHY